mmetsp:Transcript_50776/g.142709  ORF Transcript_50776/g.142709 Transcript_50776/m.142709 type:complete len:208 (+) Transcript_50776:703-1326(+)
MTQISNQTMQVKKARMMHHSKRMKGMTIIALRMRPKRSKHVVFSAVKAVRHALAADCSMCNNLPRVSFWNLRPDDIGPSFANTMSATVKSIWGLISESPSKFSGTPSSAPGPTRRAASGCFKRETMARASNMLTTRWCQRAVASPCVCQRCTRRCTRGFHKLFTMTPKKIVSSECGIIEPSMKPLPMIVRRMMNGTEKRTKRKSMCM